MGGASYEAICRLFSDGLRSGNCQLGLQLYKSIN